MPHHHPARIGDGGNGAVLVVSVGDGLGYRADGALLGQDVALGVIAPGRGDNARIRFSAGG